MASPQKKPVPKPQKKSPATKIEVKTATLSKGEEIGEAAGKVWQCINKLGEVSPSKLASETGLSTKEVQRAIGWLAREGKLIIESDGRTEVFRLS